MALIGAFTHEKNNRNSWETARASIVLLLFIEVRMSASLLKKYKSLQIILFEGLFHARNCWCRAMDHRTL